MQTQTSLNKNYTNDSSCKAHTQMIQVVKHTHTQCTKHLVSAKASRTFNISKTVAVAVVINIINLYHKW